MDNLRTVTYKTYKAIYLFFHTFISRGLSRLQAFPSFLPPSPPRSCTRNRTETLATQAKIAAGIRRTKKDGGCTFYHNSFPT